MNDRIVRALVCVNDKKSRIHSSPVCYDTFEAAKREIKRAVEVGKDIRDGQRPLIAMYPQDFECVYVADFDVVSGMVVPVDPIVVPVVEILEEK